MEPYIGEIRIVGFPFAPIGWALCDGSVLQIAQYSALFSVIGTTYGGDGKTNFALPNLQGRVPMHWGNNPSLTSRTLGEIGGAQTVTVTSIPHTHQAYGVTGGTTNSPAGAIWGSDAGRSAPPRYSNQGANVTMNSLTLNSVAGGGQPHNNMQPYMALYHIICFEGIYPTPG